MDHHMRVSKAKLSGRVTEHRAVVAHRDVAGIWLFSPAGTPVTNAAGRVVWTQPADGMQYFPAAPLPRSGGWFVAWCWEIAPDPISAIWSRRWISVDLATPENGPDARPYHFTDLELDLWCAADGLGIVDEDELAAVEQAGLITPEVAATTRAAGAELYEHLSRGRSAAFGGAGWQLLDQRLGHPGHPDR